MNVLSKLKALVQQQNAASRGDGNDTDLRASRAGQLLTADWKHELVAAGYAFNVSVGGISAGADVALITGGGAGTTIDSDQPEMAVGTPTGYYHIPLGFTCAAQVDLDADAEVGNIILFADTTQQIPLPIAASSTVETPGNLLDGGPDSVSRAQSAVTADITDPVASIVLGYATVLQSQVTAASVANQDLRLDFNPSHPILLKGPCSVIACWGGTAAVNAICSYNWAEVPIARFE